MKKKQETIDSELYSPYEWHANTLRTWLVAYGIGAPVLLLTQDKLYDKVLISGVAQSIATLFLVGVALQVLLAFWNKTIMWICHYGETMPDFKKTCRYKIAEFLSEFYIVDFLCDLASIVVFAWATFRVCAVVMK